MDVVSRSYLLIPIIVLFISGSVVLIISMNRLASGRSLQDDGMLLFVLLQLDLKTIDRSD